MHPPYRPHPSLDVDVVFIGEEAWIELSGEADSSNHQLLRHALSEVTLEEVKTVRLLLGDLDFCDVAAARELFKFARSVRQGGRDLTTQGANRTVWTLVLALGVAEDLGLT